MGTNAMAATDNSIALGAKSVTATTKYLLTLVLSVAELITLLVEMRLVH